ncbi:MAG TPA: multicopper oxidase domain-containing protein [Gemmatimonadaceae bacterium]
MKLSLFVLAQLFVSFGTTGHVLHHTPAERARLVEDALPNDNRVAAGRMVGGVLRLELEAREVLWYAEGKPGPAIPNYAFAEAGKPATVPGPMIRVPAGTEILATVRNRLSVPLRFRGFQDHTGTPLDTTIIAPDSTQTFRFRADVAGTYYYFARTEAPIRLLSPGSTRDAALTGAFIVDPAGAKPSSNDRVLVINVWSDTASSLGVKPEALRWQMRRETLGSANWFTITVNGLSWPHTERLSYAVGDTVHWRVINANPITHPMHLHGFYFDVDARGSLARDTMYTAAQRRKAVTEPLAAGATMAMTWVPTRPGNWLFHCHFVQHIDAALRLTAPTGPAVHDPSAHGNHAEQGMAGLVTGIHVAPAKGATLAGDPRPRRKLRLFVTQRANVYGDQPGLSYVLQEGPTAPAADSVRIPSSTIFLRHKEPTEITVINRSKQVASVHWHGIELESFYDGVGDWSGWGTRIAPAIAPGDSFVVHLTPERAGTFIYHSHTNEELQLSSGLFGTLIVLPEKGMRDTTERVFLFGIGGPHDDALPTVNGLRTPTPVEIRAGVPHRFRLINISPLETRIVRLVADSVPKEWRALAKDGADLPEAQATMRPARVVIAPGETFDFEVLRQRPESLALEVESAQTIAFRSAFRASGGARGRAPRIVTNIPVVVR